jgi:multidrug resistance efflux pump
MRAASNADADRQLAGQRTVAGSGGPPTLLDPVGRFPAVAPRHSPRTVRRAGWLLVAVAVLAVLELAGFGATYTFHTRLFASTDNAQVDADQVDVNAPATGRLTRWSLTQGSTLRRGEVVGFVRAVGGGPEPQQIIKAPRNGTVGLSAVANGTYVQQGQLLAAGFDLRKVWITARLAESDASRVAVGDLADIYLDAYPNVVLSGVVTELGAATAGQSDIYPSPDLNPADIQKINQYIPVRVTPYASPVPLYPGLDATVDIRIPAGQ